MTKSTSVLACNVRAPHNAHSWHVAGLTSDSERWCEGVLHPLAGWSPYDCPDKELHLPHSWRGAGGGKYRCAGILAASSAFAITFGVGPQPLSPKAERVLSGPAKEALELFAKRSADYSDKDGFDPSEVLGLQGQFAEVWRKVWKLKNSLWDGRELSAEQPREILMDLIGHALLAIDMIDRREGDSRGDEVGKVAGSV